jgi:hypothetical protein
VAYVVINKALQSSKPGEERLEDDLRGLCARQYHKANAHRTGNAEEREHARCQVLVLALVFCAGRADLLTESVSSIRWQLLPNRLVPEEVCGSKKAFLIRHRIQIGTWQKGREGAVRI